MIGLPRRFAHRELGAALVEFALVFPMLFGVVVTVFDAGMLLYDQAVITNASREATRAGIVANRLTDSDIQNIAITYCFNQLVTFDSNNRTCGPPLPSTITYPLRQTTGSPLGVTVTSPSGKTTGSPLGVTVTYRYKGMVLGTLISASWATDLQATTIMNYE